jgi:hypothetical protein
VSISGSLGKRSSIARGPGANTAGSRTVGRRPRFTSIMSTGWRMEVKPPGKSRARLCLLLAPQGCSTACARSDHWPRGGPISSASPIVVRSLHVERQPRPWPHGDRTCHGGPIEDEPCAGHAHPSGRTVLRASSAGAVKRASSRACLLVASPTVRTPHINGRRLLPPRVASARS